jgi:hypothetical protein
MSASIEDWLGELGLGQYADVFVENDVDARVPLGLVAAARPTQRAFI